MKNRILFFIMLALIVFNSCPNNTVIAEVSQFARIKSNNARLYANAEENNNISNTICYLEPTYFVEISLDFNDSFYKVIYNNTSGYVLKSAIELVNGTPNSPYPKANITSINSKCYLRSSPMVSNNNSNTIAIIPPNCSKINYIGKMQGNEVVDYKGTLWYYVEYLGEYGYIYNNYVANISLIPQNLEELEPLSIRDEILNPLSNSSCVLIITLILIPTLFIIIMLYKKPKVKVKTTQSQQKIISKAPKRKLHDDIENL